jgi:hypothetical protein
VNYYCPGCGLEMPADEGALLISRKGKPDEVVDTLAVRVIHCDICGDSTVLT